MIIQIVLNGMLIKQSYIYNSMWAAVIYANRFFEKYNKKCVVYVIDNNTAEIHYIISKNEIYHSDDCITQMIKDAIFEE